MMGYGGWGLLGGYGWLGMVVQLLLWVGIVFLVVWGAGRLFPGRQETVHETALDILKRRYASGEITAAEYQQARQDLAQ